MIWLWNILYLQHKGWMFVFLNRSWNRWEFPSTFLNFYHEDDFFSKNVACSCCPTRKYPVFPLLDWGSTFQSSENCLFVLPARLWHVWLGLVCFSSSVVLLDLNCFCVSVVSVWTSVIKTFPCCVHCIVRRVLMSNKNKQYYALQHILEYLLLKYLYQCIWRGSDSKNQNNICYVRVLIRISMYLEGLC